MIRSAVRVVAFTTSRRETVTPSPVTCSVVAPGTKLVPTTVTGTVVPCAPRFGVIDVMVGRPGPGTLIVKVCPPEVPPEVVTVTSRAPGVAVEARTKVAVIVVALTTSRLVTVMSMPTLRVVSPTMKPVPVRVTGTEVPRMPLAGLIAVSVGAPGIVTTKDCAPEVPAPVVTVTMRPPAVALAATVKVAVIDVGLTTLTLLTVTPLPLVAMVAPATKLVPVSVTATAVPRTPTLGTREVRVGAPGGETPTVVKLQIGPGVVPPGPRAVIRQ